MKNVVRAVVFTTCLLVICSLRSTRAQEAETVGDDDVLVLHFEPLEYPIPAAARHVQGAVVVQVKLDKDGGVTKASALSGPRDLVAPAINNVRKWAFQPNERKSAIVVYSFVMLDGRCRLNSSLFVLQGKNLATVISCPPNVNP
jgi:TonB family protein